MTVTLQELARFAHTSVATVSRVLNNKDGVSQEKRKNILELAERLGYQPNLFARSLVTQKSHLLGFVASSLANQEYIEFFRLIESGCRKNGYQVLIADSMLDSAREKVNVEIMLQNRAEGLIILPVFDINTDVNIDYFLPLKMRRIPFVLMGKIEGYNFDYVVAEEVESARRLTKHLIDLGHRRFGIVGVNPHNRCVVERCEGIVKALREANLCSEEHSEHNLPCRHTEWIRPDFIHTVKEWLNNDDRPTALITINDSIALDLYRPLCELGIAIPEELSVVAFGDKIWTSHLWPSFTTSRADNEQIAHLAFETLMKRIECSQEPAMQHEVPQKFIPRESSGPAPS